MKETLYALLALLPCAGPAAAQTAVELRPHAAAWERIVAAEDARARTPAQLQTLLDGLRAPADVIRVVSVRALGRLERPDLLQHITPLLHDSAAAVRAAAAQATAQAVYRVESAEARAALQGALAAARADARVMAAVAESLGRLRTSAAEDARVVVQSLMPHLAAAPAARLGVLRGLYFLARQEPARGAFDDPAVRLLRAEATAQRSDTTGPAEERAKIVALMTLPLLRAADEATLLQALEDPSPHVRREAIVAAAILPDTAALHRILRRGFGDAAPARYDAVRIYARRLAGTHGCAPLLDAARGSELHSALAAIDLLPSSCAADARSAALADSLARAAAGLVPGVPPEESWHRAAHALVALATLDAARARPLLQRYAASDNMFVRTYAARAAAAAGDSALLRRLAGDPHANVRTIALTALSRAAGRSADDLYLAALDSDDAELLMAAAAALEGSAPGVAMPALLRTLTRITALRRETSRDARLALLERIGELAAPGDAERIQPYLRDYDSAVAAAAAAILTRVTGSTAHAEAQPLPPLPLPSYAEAASLESARVLMQMESGDTIELRLLPFVAPANAYRFARLAREGYYDGLTLHRVIFNFVAQGGSPGANEHTGDGPFTRDELGAANWRGTVGLSTRGRDTGDAQFYINHADNIRLDHEYTIFGVVSGGMDVVDRLQEGARIRAVQVRQ